MGVGGVGLGRVRQSQTNNDAEGDGRVKKKILMIITLTGEIPDWFNQFISLSLFLSLFLSLSLSLSLSVLQTHMFLWQQNNKRVMNDTGQQCGAKGQLSC